MALANLRSGDSHQFGGCNRLLNQYRIVGSELLKFEVGTRNQRYSSFREGVAFIPVEVLQSYLEDLFALEMTEDKLFIARKQELGPLLFVVIGILVGMAVGLYAASSGASLVLSLFFALVCASPSIVFWYVNPQYGFTRRMAFAQVVSHEISRRMGGAGTKAGIDLSVSSWLGSRTSLQGAARVSAIQ